MAVAPTSVTGAPSAMGRLEILGMVCGASTVAVAVVVAGAVASSGVRVDFLREEPGFVLGMLVRTGLAVTIAVIVVRVFLLV